MLLATRPDLKEDYSTLFPLAPGRILIKMAEPDLATVSWLHMLPGDLFIGWWIYLDSRERGLGPWIVSPALLVTCLSGSIGFVLYLLARTLQDVVNRIYPRIEP
jgi:hypothetical protein